MARASAFHGGDFRRALRDQMAVIAQGKQADAILLQRRHPQRAIVRGNIGRVAAFQPFHHVNGFYRNAVIKTRHAHATGIIRAAEDEVAFMIGRNMGWAARQWRFCGICQRAIIRGDAVCQHAELRAHADIEKTFIRADDHWLNLPRNINNLNQRE